MLSPADHYAAMQLMLDHYESANQNWAIEHGALYLAKSQIHATAATVPWAVYVEARDMQADNKVIADWPKWAT